jgi:cytochrome c556
LTGPKRSSACSRRRLAAAIACAWLAGAVLATGMAARAQDQRAAPAQAAPAQDVIFARKSLMNFMCDAMAEIERMIAMRQVDLEGLRGSADAMSVMLLAFPHLFPAYSNQWDPAVEPDPVTGTFASPELWSNYPDFYRLATAAAESAHDMSRAGTIEDFKSHARELRIVCDTCHALYSENQ